MNTDTRRLWALVTIMALVALIVGGVAVGILYNTAIDGERNRLEDLAQAQARIIEEMIRSDLRAKRASQGERIDGEGAVQWAIEKVGLQIRRAYTKYRGFGDSGALLVAHRHSDNRIHHFLLRPGVEEFSNFDSHQKNTHSKCPMREALSGKSGSMIHHDVNGIEMLSAYAGVPAFGFGIVAKISMAEIRRPFLLATVSVLLVSLVVVGIGVFLFMRTSDPIIQAIIASRNRLRSIIDNSYALIRLKDLKGHHLLANTRFAELLEMPMDEIRGKCDRDLIPRDGAARSERSDRKVIETGIPMVYEENLLLRGEQRSFIVTKFLIRDKDGKPEGICDISTDVTDRIRAEEALGEAKRTLELQVETVNRIQALYISQEEPLKLFDALLTDILKLTDSAYGFIGEVRQSDKNRSYLRVYAMSATERDVEIHKYVGRFSQKTMEFHDLDNLFGTVIRSGEVISTNAPADHPKSGSGLPDGHPQLRSFLGIPLKRGERVVGEIVLANRSSGFDRSVLAFLEPVLATCASMIQGYRNLERRRNAEAALKESRHRLAVASDLAQLGSWERDPETDNETWSPTMFKIMGLGSSMEAEQLSLFDMAHPDDAVSVKGMLDALISGDLERSDQEFRIVRFDGEIRIIHTRAEAVLNRNGGVQRLFGTAQDITKLRQAEEKIHLQAAALEAAANAIIITDAHGRIEWFNSAFLRLSGYDYDEVVGQTPKLLRSGMHGDAFYKTLWDIILDGGVWQGEMVNRRKDGTLYHQESIITPVRGESGRIEHFIAIQQDISERKRSEAELKKFFLAVQQSPVTTVITDVDGKIEYVNPRFSEVTGYTMKEALGQNPRILKTETTSQIVYEEMWQDISSGRTWRGELLNRRKDGSLFWESTLISPIHDDDGNISNYLAVKEDITARKQAEQALKEAKQEAERANLAKSAFLATMSHEIRTPINAILGMGELLLEAPISNEQRTWLETINQAGETLLALINEILDLSKIEAGQLQLNPRPMDSSELAGGVVGILDLLAQEKGISLVLEVERDVSHPVIGDPDRIRQVLMNLVGNAIKFTEQGSVTVGIERWDGDLYRFSVQDSGVGISKEKLATVFDPFTQADASVSRQFGGTGLGLTICRRLVELMGGGIHVESHLGEGSLFSFTLPLPAVESGAQSRELSDTPRTVETVDETPGINDLHSSEASTLPAKSDDVESEHNSEDNSEDNTETITILLVDDSPDNRLLVQAFLKRTSHHVLEAENGLQALTIFEKGGVDLVLMDVQMPVMDGYTATRNLRELEQTKSWRRARVVALTAHAMREAEEEALAAGCDLYLSKPVRKKALLAAIDEQISALE
ncbi:MAG: PAS domain S-box protein [Magnetococcales bacterium]|nr:PAS domain S-box protein [Magnetococcales bacterium]